MGLKRVVMVKRKAGLTPEQFRAGYEGSHSRIAVELFGHLWTSYRRNYLATGYAFEPGGNAAGPAEIGFDAVSEFVLRDEEAAAEMGRIAMAHHEMIKEDEAKWFDQVRSFVVSCETIEEPGLG